MKGSVYTALVILLAGVGLWQLITDDPAPPEPAAVVAVEPEAPPRRRASEAPPLAPSAPSSVNEEPRTAPAAPTEPGIEVDPARHPARRAALPASLILRIRDRVGSPLADARVTLLAGSRPERTAVTGGDGEAAFDHLAPGRYGYRIAAPGRAEVRTAAALELAPGATRVVELALGDYDQTIGGQVLDQDGAPVAGLTVKARRYRPPADGSALVPLSQAEQQAETGLDGGFEIEGLEVSDYEIRTIATDRYGAAKAIVRAGGGDARLTVVERDEVTVFGRVTSAEGAPLADVRVVHLGQPSRRARTDGEGWYQLLVALPEDEARAHLRFDRQGYRGERLDLDVAALGGSHDARLDATLSRFDEVIEVAVRLIDEDGAPVAGERVYLHSSGLGTHYQAVSGAGGRARFLEVAMGSGYGVRVAPRGPYQDHARSVDLAADGDLEIVLEALSTGRLAGQMVDLAGDPLPGFSLRVHSADARAKWRQVSGDAEGYFEIEVPAGALTLQTPSMPRFRITGIEVAPGADADALLALDWGEAVLEGRVVDARGDPLPGAEADLHWAQSEGGVQSRATRRTVTDARGAFRFEHLGRAPHRLEVGAAGHQSHRETVQPGADWVEVRLEPR